MWAQLDADGVVRVLDKSVQSRTTIDIHVAEIKARTPAGETAVAGTFCDPSGTGVNDVTKISAVRRLRELGIATRYKQSRILEGIELVQRAVRRGDGSRQLLISPKCQRLIEAMSCYHYPHGFVRTGGGELPVKDGLYDHPIDALRHFFVNYYSGGKAAIRRY